LFSFYFSTALALQLTPSVLHCLSFVLEQLTCTQSICDMMQQTLVAAVYGAAMQL
jgi:hypothetical protein